MAPVWVASEEGFFDTNKFANGCDITTGIWKNIHKSAFCDGIA